ncbi:hypothetical protein [uncultured Tateyamaria sp.]|uniref:hypothetical protein n=1 Tax=uncultured Tateyamaria sp. TaxID=455651 RepID=UPI002629FF5E|nr:hypothetical protein [uncultured Tateyamaria sp.]
MSRILSFPRPLTRSQQHDIAFDKLVSTNLWADITRKKEVLRSFGNPTATVKDGREDFTAPGNYVALMFSGTGPLEGYSFSFAIKADAAPEIKAEIHAFHIKSKALLTKEVGRCKIQMYNSDWLSAVYNEALDLIAPEAKPDRSTKTLGA